MDEYPKNLSGGQKQRVAIARLYLSCLNYYFWMNLSVISIFSRKTQLQDKLFAYVREQNISLIISTHDITEILPWIDEVVVLQEGPSYSERFSGGSFFNHHIILMCEIIGRSKSFNTRTTKELGLPNWFYFPHQLKFTENEGTDAEVIESGFREVLQKPCQC